MDCTREFSQQWFLNRKNHNSFHCGSIYFQNLKNEIEEKLLLNPPMKINLPGLQVMRKCKAEIFCSNKGDSHWAREACLRPPRLH